jgi:predicted RNase H-like nuclease (RuvC/YqgF family)
MEFNANLMTEEEAEEVYENILNLYQTKMNDLTSKNEDLELQLQEIRMELDIKESELLDSQISGTQTASSDGDEQKRRMIRSLKEKVDDLSDELKAKNSSIEVLSKELQQKIGEISQLHDESEDLKLKLEEYESNDQNEDLV